MAMEAIVDEAIPPSLDLSHPRRSARFSEQYRSLFAEYRGIPLDVSFRAMVGPLPANDLTHSLFPYPARLVRHIPMFLMGATEFASPGSTILDPFCGSGTVLVEGQAWGHDAVGVDANPIAVLAASVKTQSVNEERLGNIARKVKDRAVRLKASEAPAAFLEKWYSKQAISVLGRLARALGEELASPELDCVKLAFALTCRVLSWTDPRLPVPVLRVPSDTSESYASVWMAYQSNVARVSRSVLAGGTKASNARVLEGDSRKPSTFQMTTTTGPVVMVTSPPYGAAQKYLRSTSLEAGWLGYTEGNGTIDLERRSIGREHLSSAERVVDTSGFSQLLISKLHEVTANDSMRGFIYANYFRDMREALSASIQAFPSLERIALVGGTNVAAGIDMQTHEFLCEMVQQNGYELKLTMRDAIKGRSLLTSRKGAAKPAVFEYVHILERAK